MVQGFLHKIEYTDILNKISNLAGNIEKNIGKKIYGNLLILKNIIKIE